MTVLGKSGYSCVELTHHDSQQRQQECAKSDARNWQERYTKRSVNTYLERYCEADDYKGSGKIDGHLRLMTAPILTKTLASLYQTEHTMSVEGC